MTVFFTLLFIHFRKSTEMSQNTSETTTFYYFLPSIWAPLIGRLSCDVTIQSTALNYVITQHQSQRPGKMSSYLATFVTPSSRLVFCLDMQKWFTSSGRKCFFLLQYLSWSSENKVWVVSVWQTDASIIRWPPYFDPCVFLKRRPRGNCDSHKFLRVRGVEQNRVCVLSMTTTAARWLR